MFQHDEQKEGRDVKEEEKGVLVEEFDESEVEEVDDEEEGEVVVKS